MEAINFNPNRWGWIWICGLLEIGRELNYNQYILCVRQWWRLHNSEFDSEDLQGKGLFIYRLPTEKPVIILVVMLAQAQAQLSGHNTHTQHIWVSNQRRDEYHFSQARNGSHVSAWSLYLSKLYMSWSSHYLPVNWLYRLSFKERVLDGIFFIIGVQVKHQDEDDGWLKVRPRVSKKLVIHIDFWILPLFLVYFCSCEWWYF